MEVLVGRNKVGRKKKEQKIYTCNRFELTASVDAETATLEFTLLTDLPLETDVSIWVRREFFGEDGEERVWNYEEPWYDLEEHNENTRILKGKYSILDGDIYAKSKCDDIDLKNGRLTDRIEVRATTTFRQQSKIFGPRNQNLSGDAVTIEKETDSRIVESEVFVSHPFNPSLLSPKVRKSKNKIANKHLQEISKILLIEDRLKRAEELQDYCIGVEDELGESNGEALLEVYKHLTDIDTEKYDDLLQGVANTAREYLK